MPGMSDKCCAILLAMGGPDHTSGVQEYLYNIFSDRSIIQLPGGALMQKPFASLISRLRRKKVQHHYDLIGGSSPLLKWTQAQAMHVENVIRQDFPGFRTYVGMRYYRPYAVDVVQQAYADGFRQIYFIPMYPQYCKATTGSSFEAVGKVLRRFPDLKATFIKDFHQDQDYIGLLRKYIQANIRDDETLLILGTLHSTVICRRG